MNHDTRTRRDLPIAATLLVVVLAVVVRWEPWRLPADAAPAAAVARTVAERPVMRRMLLTQDPHEVDAAAPLLTSLSSEGRRAVVERRTATAVSRDGGLFGRLLTSIQGLARRHLPMLGSQFRPRWLEAILLSASSTMAEHTGARPASSPRRVLLAEDDAVAEALRALPDVAVTPMPRRGGTSGSIDRQWPAMTAPARWIDPDIARETYIRTFCIETTASRG